MKKNAFSLIELSIVILIIGILIVGVAQSGSLVGKFRLSSARNLTQNSSVASIPGMIFWVDSVSEKSFDDADQDNTDPVCKIPRVRVVIFERGVVLLGLSPAKIPLM